MVLVLTIGFDHHMEKGERRKRSHNPPMVVVTDETVLERLWLTGGCTVFWFVSCFNLYLQSFPWHFSPLADLRYAVFLLSLLQVWNSRQQRPGVRRVPGKASRQDPRDSFGRSTQHHQDAIACGSAGGRREYSFVNIVE